MKTFLLPLAFVCIAALPGCEAMFRINAEDAQAIVNQRVVGMSMGDFVQRYGRPALRTEAADGTVTINWEGGFSNVAAGPRGTEELLCRLHVTANRTGRIASAVIVRDGPGKRHLSRCAELFEPA